MKIIRYKTLGAMLELGPDGKPIRKDVSVTTEVPYSQEALRKAESTALPGTVQTIERKDPADTAKPVQSICFSDRATGKTYEVYVENGQLMMEVL